MFVCSIVNYIESCYFIIIEKGSWIQEYFILSESKDNVICKFCLVVISSIIQKGIILLIFQKVIIYRFYDICKFIMNLNFDLRLLYLLIFNLNVKVWFIFDGYKYFEY